MIRVLHSVANMDRAGIETMIMNYYRLINREEIQFDFLCSKKKHGAYDEEIIKMGGKIYRSPSFNPLKYFSYLRYMKEILANNSECSIIHAHNGALVVFPLFAAKINGIKHRIAHMHSSSFTPDFKRLLKLLCKPLIPLVATNLWACGKKASQFYYGKKTNPFVIRNAIEADKFLFSEEIRNQVRKKYNIENKFVVGHIGRFVYEKNHKFLIEIFAKLHEKNGDSVLVLLGEGAYEEEIKQKVEQMGIQDSVLFIGQTNKVDEWYQAFDVFVLPSISEGLPVVGIEAQAADLPCIFSKDVTDEVGILPNVRFIDRSDTIEYWVKNIIDIAKGHNRKDRSKEIKEAGYDIYTEVVRLENLYKQMSE